jgi:hypothetical protein
MSKQKNVPEYFKISSHFPSQNIFSPKNLILKISTFFANNIISVEAAKGTTSLRYSIANYSLFFKTFAKFTREKKICLKKCWLE